LITYTLLKKSRLKQRLFAFVKTLQKIPLAPLKRGNSGKAALKLDFIHCYGLSELYGDSVSENPTVPKSPLPRGKQGDLKKAALNSGFFFSE